MIQDSVPLVVSRQVVSDLAEAIFTLPSDAFVAIAEHALKVLHTRINSFEEHFSTISEKLASIFESSGKFRAAADLLAAIPLDSGQRCVLTLSM